jgi:hypothetical protein
MQIFIKFIMCSDDLSKNSTRYNNVVITLRVAVYRQSVLLGDKSLETHEEYFIFQLNTCGYISYVTSSLTRGWVLSFAIAAGPRQRSHSHV